MRVPAPDRALLFPHGLRVPRARAGYGSVVTVTLAPLAVMPEAVEANTV